MASKASIIAAIQSKVGSTQYGTWRIGLTHDLADRKRYWGDTQKQDITHWSDRTGDSLSDAQDIESRFINKGMRGGTGGDLSAYKTVHIYIF